MIQLKIKIHYRKFINKDDPILENGRTSPEKCHHNIAAQCSRNDAAHASQMRINCYLLKWIHNTHQGKKPQRNISTF